MKKYFAVLCVIFLFASFVSCQKEIRDGQGTGAKGTELNEEGWISNNEFRVNASGETELTSVTPDVLQKGSEAAAVKKARENTVRTFVSTRIKTSSGAGTYAAVALAIEKEFREVIESGKVIRKTFENSDKRCVITYSVTKDGLKKLVETGKK